MSNELAPVQGAVDWDPATWALFNAGEVRAWPGRDPRKPVLRWAAGNTKNRQPGTVAPGSGVSPRHVDAENGRDSGWRRTKEYRDLMERVMSPEDGGQFEAVLQGMIDASTGVEKVEWVTCPECDHKFTHKTKSAPDPRAGIKLLEFGIGRAIEQKEVHGRVDVVHEMLTEMTDIDEITVHSLSPEEQKARRERVEAYDPDEKPGEVIDGEFTEEADSE